MKSTILLHIPDKKIENMFGLRFFINVTNTKFPNIIIGRKKSKKYVAPPNIILVVYATKEGMITEGSVFLTLNFNTENVSTRLTILPTNI